MSRTITIRAPFNGYVTQVYVNNGSALEPNGKILELVDPSHLHAELMVFERDAHSVKADQPIDVQISGEKSTRKGHVHLVGTEINDDRTVYVHAHLNEADLTLRPGTTLTAIIETGGTEVDAITSSAIVRHDGRSWIFTRESDTTFIMHEVKVGKQSDGMSAIESSSDLHNQQIVVNGANHLLGVLTKEEE